MLVFVSLFLILTSAANGAEKYTDAARADQITDLPGLPNEYTGNQFGGYINVTNGHVFYWYVEAQVDPRSAPVIWWTNGGPGCSGMNGFLEENGPFRPNAQGGLDINPYSWNLNANMVFVEQPVGVGFSKANVGVQYGDSMAAKDNHAFIEGFFARYPELYNREFYLSSESYGGHYLPTLAQNLVKNPIENVNFRGFLVGNPLTYLPFRNYGQYFTFWGHQLLPKPLWENLESGNCFDSNATRECDQYLQQADSITMNLDPYALDFPTCTSGLRAGREERRAMQKVIHRANNKKNRLKGYFPPNYEPCEDSYTQKYMNRPDVQEAIHANSMGTWEVCNNAVNAGWPGSDVEAPMMPIYNFLVDQGLNIMIYSGDDDAVCATAGTQQFLWNMGWSVTQNWKEWQTDGVTSGWETIFSNNFVFKTVHGAGHMVPSTRPEQALNMLKQFLKK